MTSLSRRSVLKGAAALGGTSLFSAPSFADSSLPVLRAAPASAQLAPDGYPSTPVWAYATEAEGRVPGPEIRLTAGERVGYRLVNDLPQPTAVHWHGTRIENAMYARPR